MAIKIPKPSRPTRNNYIENHIYLSDKQYDFCYYYAFGLPVESCYDITNLGVLSLPSKRTDLNELLANESDYEPSYFRAKRLALEYLPKYKSFSVAMKHKYLNGLGSYMFAYHCKNYETAKTEAKKLLKNRYILLELYLMQKYCKKKGSRYYANDYKSKLTLNRVESGELEYTDSITIEDLTPIDIRLKALGYNYSDL